LRRFLHRPHAAPRRPAERLGRAGPAASLRVVGRRHRRQRAVAARGADGGAGAGAAVRSAATTNASGSGWTRA
jgi:hypothetical protein